MNMAIKSFTNKKVKELNDNLSKTEEEIKLLSGKTEKMLWIEDLNAVEEGYHKFFEAWKKEHDSSKKKKKEIRKVKKNKIQPKKAEDKDKDKDKKGPKPKKLPGFEEDTQDTTQKKNKKNEGDDSASDNTEKKVKKQNKKEIRKVKKNKIQPKKSRGQR